MGSIKILLFPVALQEPFTPGRPRPFVGPGNPSKEPTSREQTLFLLGPDPRISVFVQPLFPRRSRERRPVQGPSSAARRPSLPLVRNSKKEVPELKGWGLVVRELVSN